MNKKKVRETANIYRAKVEEFKKLELEIKALKTLLIEEQVNEFFLEDQEKVVLQEGRTLSHLDVSTVMDFIDPEDLSECCVVTKASLKDSGLWEDEEVDKIVAGSRVVDGKAASSVLVKKMSKKDLVEATKGKLK